jgi:uncharacterized protein YchJ
MKDYLQALGIAAGLIGKQHNFSARERVELDQFWERQRINRERFDKATEVLKLGRNKPCPCNSGKKIKKCCGYYQPLQG